MKCFEQYELACVRVKGHASLRIAAGFSTRLKKLRQLLILLMLFCRQFFFPLNIVFEDFENSFIFPFSFSVQIVKLKIDGAVIVICSTWMMYLSADHGL